MHVLDSNTKELITTLKMNGTVNDIAFMHGGRHMLSVGDEGVVHIWDMNTRQCIHTFIDEVIILQFLCCILRIISCNILVILIYD